MAGPEGRSCPAATRGARAANRARSPLRRTRAGENNRLVSTRQRSQLERQQGEPRRACTGAWQPSLNIATVLTSIGLLLSDPNPDDGLMAEISREYKYNRQVFDLNARSWTEKYANAAATGASGWSSVDVSIQVQNTQKEAIESQESLPKVANTDCEGSRKKMRLLGKKLSLKSEGHEENTTTSKQDLVASHLPSMSKSTVSTVKSEGPSKRSNVNYEDKLLNHLPISASSTKDSVMESSDDVLEKSREKSIAGSLHSLYKASEGDRTRVRSLGQKMSLKLANPANKSNDQKENMAPNKLPSLSGFSNLQTLQSDASRKSFVGDTKLVQQNYNTEHVLPNAQLIPNKECTQGRKKLQLLSKRLSLKSDLPADRTSEKQCMPADCSKNNRRPSELPSLAPVLKSQKFGSTDPQKDVSQSNSSIKQSTIPMETTVVSDSEDSADECERPSRSKLSLMRRRLAGKLKN